MHTVGSCFRRLLAALLLGSMVVSIASAGAPFGGDDPGCLPDAGSASCQLALTKAIGKAYACLIKCHGDRASGKLADGAAEVACETGDPKKSCKAKYDRATGPDSKLEKTCAAGFDAGYRAALFTAAGTDVAGAVGRLFPCGTVTTTTSTTTTLPAVCGDGVRQPSEECDDGNTTSGDGCSAACVVEPPPGQTAAQVTALHAVNGLRASAGARGMTLSAQLDLAAQRHADYYHSNVTNPMCVANPHVEINACVGFTGAQFFDRDAAAGFTGSPVFEDMAFFGDPTAAIALWVDSVFHRIPLLAPSVGVMGYGGALAVDVADFGAVTAESADQIVVYPPPGATGVPGSFNGNEGPPPPAPPTGFPSGPIVSLQWPTTATVSIASHEIFDAQNVSLPHVFVSETDPTLGALLPSTAVMYAYSPAPAGATFRVVVSGTQNGHAFTRDWTFSVQ